MSFETVSPEKRNTITLAESWALNKSFISDTIVGTGTPMKLKTNGEVTPITAVTDKPFGIVTSGCKAVGGRVTIQMPFASIVNAEADGTVAINDEVACSGMSVSTGTTAGYAKYKTAVSTNYIIGRALTGNTTGNLVIVGIYRSAADLKA